MDALMMVEPSAPAPAGLSEAPGCTRCAIEALHLRCHNLTQGAVCPFTQGAVCARMARSMWLPLDPSFESSGLCLASVLCAGLGSRECHRRVMVVPIAGRASYGARTSHPPLPGEDMPRSMASRLSAWLAAVGLEEVEPMLVENGVLLLEDLQCLAKVRVPCRACRVGACSAHTHTHQGGHGCPGS